MRLLTKSIAYYLLVSLPLLALAGVFSYYIISMEVHEGTDESLEREKKNAIHLIKEMRPSSTVCLSSDSLSYIQPLSISRQDMFGIGDTALFDPAGHEKKDYRLLKGCYTTGGKSYLIQLSRPMFEEEELVESLVSSLFLVIGFLVAAFFIVNWLLSKTLWKPFNRTLEALSSYSLTDRPELTLERTSTKEFQQLNDTLVTMTDKIHSDYKSQKDFTENASHELQTPLAVMKAAVDNLFQSQHLHEEELNQLQAIERAVSKLSQLNKALLLLAKIENNQFRETQSLDLKSLISQLAEDYGAIYEAKQMTLHKKFLSPKQVQMHPLLTELLLGNLIKNAFKHGNAKGTVTIDLTDGTFSISNSGEALNMAPEELFTRFKKNDASSGSMGLGLAIVKSIAQLYGYPVSYAYKNNQHVFMLQFH